MANKIPLSRKSGMILLFSIIYKIILELSFWKVLTIDYPFFEFEFNILKYLNGCIWLIIILLQIRYDRKMASTFFLYFILVLQIIPITIIYAFTGGTSPVYYNLLCIGFWTCEMIIGGVRISRFHIGGKRISPWILPAFFVLSLAIVMILVYKNGMPTLEALNVYDVYELRRSGRFQIGKYAGYLLNSVVTVCLPILMIKAINAEQKFLFIFAFISIFVIYLYTGHKTYLFSIALCIVGSIFAKKRDTFTCFFKCFLAGMCFLAVLTMVWPGENNMVVRIYSLLVRRTLFVPAELKFIHYDYFSSHPHLGLYGSIPVMLNPYVPEYYTTHSYPFEIGAIYYNSPQMSADTGFFAEGYARFGFVGLILSLVFLALILKQIDSFQSRTSYATAISFFIYPIYALAEQQILSTIVLGTWMFLFIILNHYKEKKEENSDVCISTLHKVHHG